MLLKFRSSAHQFGAAAIVSGFICKTLRPVGPAVFASHGVRYSSHFSQRSARALPSAPKSQAKPNNDDALPLELDQDYAHAREFMRIPGTQQRLFLVQPRLTKFSRDKNRRNELTTLELQMDENKTLLSTLGWTVEDTITLNVGSYDSSYVFGSGNFEKLEQAVRNSPAVSGIFFGINILKAKQLRAMREAFQLPIYDRYRIVLEIFRTHAKTREAKLQVALAELPYVRHCLMGWSDPSVTAGLPVRGSSGGGSSGESWREAQNKIIRNQEGKLRGALEKVKENRRRIRENRMRSQTPTIAVVGYTNGGKTSLIKALTQDNRLIPEDKLFATLDVTTHGGVLPNNVKVLYADTIGFISDIPTLLIASFGAVLEEVALADVVVHVRDISHPDAKSQKATVLNQLKDLNLPEKLLENAIEVCNKCDKIPKESWSSDKVDADPNAIFVSATQNIGIFELRQRVEEAVMKNADLSEKVFRIPQNGKELSWLYREADIYRVEADPSDSEYLIVHCTVTPEVFARFVHEFRKIQVRSRHYTPPSREDSVDSL
ncbi:putative GTP-binding protein 6 [Paramacrobiotus metropolitanus]|uniref:putative GTP-binding protein 6 n=1 Tax=Paramacrobiotus metropolitanus TaxID=2943436 RepID=UPI002445FB1C|nr:putative GTP-binding protein 6 [Paramacrobiotus metropolitanus]XP_055327986.1 putative GTP-binding protein 6 [Paramacrobiotus metropolitanus]